MLGKTGRSRMVMLPARAGGVGSSDEIRAFLGTFLPEAQSNGGAPLSA
jgi:hypothetical protein